MGFLDGSYLHFQYTMNNNKRRAETRKTVLEMAEQAKKNKERWTKNDQPSEEKKR